ncbi:MAG: hypothetical protein IPK83_06400 [Planctomycetes bacterium]|nr:hypothetical protein [Planctomycetota bacterium]
MFDPVTNLSNLFDTGLGFIGLILEVFFGPFLIAVVGPLVRISEYFAGL